MVHAIQQWVSVTVMMDLSERTVVFVSQSLMIIMMRIKLFLTYIKMEPLAFDFQHVHLEHLEQGVCRIAHV